MQPAINLYMAIPSVVYGFIGITVIVPAVRHIFGVSGGFGIFTASFILAIMILPTVISISADALSAVPPALEEGSIALGATYWQTIWHIALPTALPGIITGVVLGMDYVYDLPYLQLINSNSIGIEIMQSVAGSFGIILTVPLSAAFSAWLPFYFNKGK